MRVFFVIGQLMTLLSLPSIVASLTSPTVFVRQYDNTTAISPKVIIISLFIDEGEIWYGIPEFNLLANNITVPGLSPFFPDVHCTADGQICQLITGEAEINAGTSISSLVASPLFNLTSTYFMIGGIAGINPEQGTLGSVTFARYAVQVALQYEFDAREIPANFTTGYVPQGATFPGEYPTELYGTEVFEVNDALRKMAVAFAQTAKLNSTAAAQSHSSNYGFGPTNAGPGVVECDVATSDVYFSGDLLSEAFGNTTSLFTNGSAVYCTTAQEDNAILEALLRGALANLTDFSRIIVMRTASDFDRPYTGQADTTNVFYDSQGFEPGLQNIYLAGVKVVEGIVDGWSQTFCSGINATNYIGDIFGSLGGTPDFGPGPAQEPFLRKRSGVVRQGRRSVRRRLT